MLFVYSGENCPLEHNQSLHISHEGQVFIGPEWSGRPYRCWTGVLLCQGKTLIILK